MMDRNVLMLVLISAIVTEVYNKPTYKSGIRGCFKQECPAETFACEQFTRVSEDKKQIVADIRCLDLHNTVLRNVTNYRDNPYSPDTNFKGYSYTFAFQISVDNNYGDEDSHKESHETKEKTNSEVDDLIK